MNGPVLIPICSWFLTALSDFFNSLLGNQLRREHLYLNARAARQQRHPQQGNAVTIGIGGKDGPSADGCERD
jgi:hypothetical protein